MGHRLRGFILLELLLFIVVLAVLVGVLSLTATGTALRQARQEGEVLTQLLQSLRERAVLEDQDYGLHIVTEGYQLLRFVDADWQLMKTAYRLPSGLYFNLETKGQPRALSQTREQPQILILSSDQISVFTLSFETAMGQVLSISSNAKGELSMAEY